MKKFTNLYPISPQKFLTQMRLKGEVFLNLF